jgi:hypothetical protein
MKQFRRGNQREQGTYMTSILCIPFMYFQIKHKIGVNRCHIVGKHSFTTTTHNQPRQYFFLLFCVSIVCFFSFFPMITCDCQSVVSAQTVSWCHRPREKHILLLCLQSQSCRMRIHPLTGTRVARPKNHQDIWCIFSVQWTSISMRALVDVDIATYASEGRRDDKEELHLHSAQSYQLTSSIWKFALELSGQIVYTAFYSNQTSP